MQNMLETVRGLASACRSKVIIAAMAILAPGAAAAANASQDINQFWLDIYGGGSPASSLQTLLQPGPLDQQSMTWELLAKAMPDELYKGMPKVNESYVFSLTKAGDRLWFGTASNMLCMVLSGDFGIAIPIEAPGWVCEADDSNPPQSLLKDFRPPHIYAYDLKQRTLTDMAAGLTGADLARLNVTYGLRAAGTLNGVVLLAGPELGNKAVNIFAYRASDKAFLGSQRFAQWGNVRDAKAIGGSLYFAMQETAVLPAPQGSIQRWTGSAASPFQFTTVGTLQKQSAAFLAEHQGRVYVSTWYGLGALPSLNPPPEANGIFMSPPIPNGGSGPLPASTASWTKVFDFATNYENDPLVALTYFGGAMASYGGYLYFGTINNPLAGIFGVLLAQQQGAINLDCGSGIGVPEVLNAALGTFRPTSVFRGSNFDTVPQVELLYGSEYWPSLVHEQANNCDRYEILPLSAHRNNLGQAPRMGAAGINNFFNAYTWTMATYDDKLFLGTFDWTSLAADAVLDLVPQSMGVLSSSQSVNGAIMYPLAAVGADLWRFNGPDTPAAPETRGGFGNWSNYGVRSLLADDKLYVGTANPFNLRTGSRDRTNGGWELIRIGRLPPPEPIPALTAGGLIAIELMGLILAALVLRRRALREKG